jgi:predicted XRE-type DNA-binding protein
MHKSKLALNKASHLGQDFDEYLAEEGVLEETYALALKRVISMKIEGQMRLKKITKTEMARRMNTSRAALNRLLDASETSLTLTTLVSALRALELDIRVQITARG